jgi:hypothetical protein
MSQKEKKQVGENAKGEKNIPTGKEKRNGSVPILSNEVKPVSECTGHTADKSCRCVALELNKVPSLNNSLLPSES